MKASPYLRPSPRGSPGSDGVRYGAPLQQKRGGGGRGVGGLESLRERATEARAAPCRAALRFQIANVRRYAKPQLWGAHAGQSSCPLRRGTQRCDER
jgi:hypothetical protein